jgi:hypothetical protein
MKNANTLFNHDSTTAPREKQIGLLTLIVLFVCGFAASASAQWTLLPTSPSGGNLAGIQVGSQAWGREASGRVYQDIGGTFTLIDPAGTPQFAHITVGVGATPFWGLTSAGESYNYNGSTFVNVPLPTGEAFTSIAAGGEGVWAVDSTTGHAYKYDSKTNTWNPPPTGEPSEHFETISAGRYAIGPWAIDSSGNPWLYNSRTGFFDAVSGIPSGETATQVAVGNGQAWALSSSTTNNVYLYDENQAVETLFHPNVFATPELSGISESTDENLWGVTSSGEVYLFNTSSITFGLAAQPPETIFEVKVGGAGIFALAMSTGHVYQYK